MKKPIHFLLYSVATGRISTVGKVTREEDIYVAEGQAKLTGHYLTREQARGLYVDPSSAEPVRPRPSFDTPPASLALGTDLSIPAVPAGTKVYVDESLLGETTAEEVLEIGFDTDGSFDIRLEPPWPWVALSHKVEVTP